MPRGTPSRFAIGLALLACLVVGVSTGEGQGLKVENFFPHQVPRGQSTLINLIIATPDAIKDAEITPAGGVTISGIKQGEPGNARGRYPGGAMWSEMTIEVAPDATPGARNLVVTMPTGRLPPVTVTIPTHVPTISDLRAIPGPSRPSAIELQFAVNDASADLRESPYVWFTTSCGRDPLLGVVRGKLSAKDTSTGVVRATVPVPPAEAGGTATASRTCDVQVRVADSLGFESNTLDTAADVTN